MTRYALAFVTLLLAAVGGLRAQDEPLLNVEGKLTRDDPVDPVLKKGFHKVYTIKLEAEAYCQIDLVSKDFDAYLRLEDASGKQLAEDDDGSGSQDARLVYQAPKADSYRVVVTSFDAAKIGSFRLTVRRIDRDAAERANRVIAAWAASGQAQHLYQQVKLPEATARLRQALDLLRKAYPRADFPNGHADLIFVLNNLGGLLEQQGELDEAAALLREALAMLEALYPQAQDRRDMQVLFANVRNNLGAVLVSKGEHGEAERLYRQAAAMFKVLYPSKQFPDGHASLASSLNNLGYVLQLQGESEEAERYYREALAMRRKLYPAKKHPRGHPLLALSLYSVGFVLQAQARYDEAEQFQSKALAMRRGALFPKETYPDGHADLAQSLNGLGGLCHAQGQYARANQFDREALAMRRALYPHGHAELAQSMNNLAIGLDFQGKHDQAEALYREALAMRRALYPRGRYPHGHRDVAISLGNLGLWLHSRDKYAEAEPLLRELVTTHTELARQLARTAPEPVALNAAATFPYVRDGLLSAAAHLPGSAGRTYEAIWHARAALTRVYQRRHLALIAAASDPKVRQRWDALQRLRQQREQLIMAPLPKGAGDRRDRLAELNAAIDAAEREIAPLLPAVKHYEDLARLGPDALQERLPADTVLIDLLRYVHFSQDPQVSGPQGAKRTPRYVAFVVSRQRLQRVELGDAADIDGAVRQWRGAITAKAAPGNDAALARPAAALRRLLWEPIEKHLPPGAVTLYLAPDAELTQLPWAALPGKAKDRVLLEDYALAVLPHGPYLLEQLIGPPPRSAKRPPAPDGMLLVGGIRYDEQPGTVAAAGRGGEGVVAQPVRWGYLPGTEAERALIAQLVQKRGPKLSAGLAGTSAGTVRLRQELEHCRYAHLATHGFFADATFRSILQLDEELFKPMRSTEGDILERRGATRSPLVLSGLVCAGANLKDTPERGILSGDAIAGLLLDDLYLATLSACDTGIGDVAGGEGVFGLQRAFHIAGCQNVVASLWKVPDRPTAALMALFYQNLWDKKLPPIEALRQAQLEIYRHPERIGALTADVRGTFKEVPGSAAEVAATGPGGTAHPRLWAAWTLSGAGQ